MRRFLLKSLAVLLPVVMFFAVCEFSYRAVDNDYKFKNSWLKHNANTVQVLSLGSSHTYYGIDPSCFDFVTFNAAHVSQDFHYDLLIFDKFIDHMESLRFVIIPVSYFSPYYSLEKEGDAWRSYYYHIYYEGTLGLKIYNGQQFKRSLGNFIHKYNDLNCSALGQGTLYRYSERCEDLGGNGLQRASDHTKQTLDNDLYLYNLNKVRQIIKSCDERSVSVILLTTPTYITYRNHVNGEQLDKMFEFCNALVSEFENVTYLNLWDDARFNADDFYDSDHLSCDVGAVKLSNIVNKYIVSLYDSPPL